MSFISNLGWRYATKNFDVNKKVDEETLGKILESIHLAPSSFGIQPFHVTVITDPELRAKIKEKAWNQPQITSASHLLVFSSLSNISGRVDQYVETASAGNPEIKIAMKDYEAMLRGFAAKMKPEEALSWSANQGFIALGFALAACAELDVDSCPMEGFDPVAVKEIIGFGPDQQPIAFLPIGYRAAEDIIRPKVRFAKEDLFDFK
ncbi:MAG: NAD(P)H-dependent oxidoreductase [Candidatus Pacebacteria bacterium]|nr:NAD(P)H-dependent oxidoreductase [Candidatus Paceibacterota bacterium]